VSFEEFFMYYVLSKLLWAAGSLFVVIATLFLVRVFGGIGVPGERLMNRVWRLRDYDQRRRRED
jgi:hypothetical protein